MNSIGVSGRTLECSVGGLVVPPGKASIDDLIRSADNLMYQAKLRGACIQLGIATEVRSAEHGRARAGARMLRTPARGGKKPAVERRASSAGYVTKQAS